MVFQLLVRTPGGRVRAPPAPVPARPPPPTSGAQSFPLDVTARDRVDCVRRRIEEVEGVAAELQRLTVGGRDLAAHRCIGDYGIGSGDTVHLALPLRGGMDFQNRGGAKPGGVGQRTAQQEGIERRERLRKLAMETIDLSKDPYFMRNHLGTYECKLCLTLHPTESSYLAHTQAKRHQENLARRAAREAQEASMAAGFDAAASATVQVRRTIKIGRPGYKVVKQRDPTTGQRSLLFEVSYPEIKKGFQPRHRFMSAFEQRVERPDPKFQYILFAAEPYEIIGFKVPNKKIDKREGKFSTHWDKDNKIFTLQLYFLDEDNVSTMPRSFASEQPMQESQHIFRA